MKLENVQIEIKNKEHYEAVKKRLQELGKWKWWNLDAVDEQALQRNYKAIISFEEYAGWGNCDHEKITLDDLYEVKKEKVIKERFGVSGVTLCFVFYCDTYQEAMDFIRKQDGGTYEIKRFHEAVEE